MYVYVSVHFLQARILREGLSQLAAGEPVLKWKDSERTFPAEAGTFNHRAEAFYRSFESNPENALVQEVARRGLKSVKFLTLGLEAVAVAVRRWALEG